MTPQEKQALDTALAIVATVGPALGPNGAIISAAITAGVQALSGAGGQDVTDDQLQAVFDQFSLNAADDLAAQAAARKL